MAQKTRPAKLAVRTALTDDVPAILDLAARIYPDEPPYTARPIRSQITTFPEGQFIVSYEGEVVGYAATFITTEAAALAAHSWAAITGGGFASNHTSGGDWLYGMEVMVDPARRRLRIGHRLYEARRALCEAHDLKGIVFGGRLPGYESRRAKFPDPADYLDAVINKSARDPVIGFHLKMGFEAIGLLHNYNPDDTESGGMATHMVWRNPAADGVTDALPVNRRDNQKVRVATVQLQMRDVGSEAEFYGNVEYFVAIAANYGSDFAVFPEYFTHSLLTLDKTMDPPDIALAKQTERTPDFIATMRQMAISRNINIIGGSHPTKTDDGEITNVAYIFLRDGSVFQQPKIHPTPDERTTWNVIGGDSMNVIQTDCGPIGVMVCYDSEFPELPRRLADQGARIMFVPFQTDSRQGHLRVRYCCQARAIENQCFVVTSGNVGNLPHVDNLDINYAQSAILTPSDYPFARDGIAAEASENVEQIIFADLDLALLDWARAEGAVQNFNDRRPELYSVEWHGK